MEFRDYAAKETLALLTRLLTSKSEASLQQIRSLREALEAAERAVEASPQVDGDVQELVGRLNNAAGAVVRRIREEARAAIDAAQNELEQLRSEYNSVTGARDDAEAHARRLESDLHDARERAESIERELEDARHAHARLESAHQETEAARHHEADARASAETALASARVQIDASVIEVSRLTSQLESEIAEHLHVSDELGSAKKANAQLEADRAEAEAFATREAQARVEVEAELRTVRDLFDSAASDAASLQAQLDAALNEVARLGGQLEAESNENISLKGDLAAAREAREHLESSLSSAEQRADRESDARSSIEHELHEVRAGLDASLSESADVATQLESAVSEKGRLQRDLAAVQVELETAQAQRDAMGAQLKAATARIRTLEREQSKHGDVLSDLEARLAGAADAESGLRERAEMSERDRDDAHEEAVLLRDERDRLVSLLHVSVEGIDALVSATTVGDLLAALAGRLAIQFPRVAVFRVRGNHLEGEHQVGLEQANDVTKLIIPLGLDSLLTRVASSKSIESVISPDPGDGATPFGGSPTFAIGLPLVLQGETLAVAYADDSGERTTEQAAVSIESATAYATLVVRQSIVLLMRLTHELKTLTELRDYARMLLQEAEQMYLADADAGRTDEELRVRLTDNIDCARQLYAQRAALEGSAAAGLLDDQIAATIDAQQSTPFARELAAIVGHLDLRRAAEAS